MKLNIKTKKLVETLFVWNYKTRFKWRWIQFSDYTNYEFWDDSKYIDFLASQKEQKLLVKRFEEERELEVFFLLDTSRYMNFWYKDTKKIDSLKNFFALLWYQVIKNNDRIWALIFDENGYLIIKPWKWKKTLIKILSNIDDKKIFKKQNTNLQSILTLFNNLPIKNSLVFLLTDITDNIDTKTLKISSIKNDFVVVNVYDFFENNLLSESWSIWLKFGFQNIFLNLRNKKKIDEYKKLRQQKIYEEQKRLQKLWIDSIYIDDKTNIQKTLLNFFTKR